MMVGEERSCDAIELRNESPYLQVCVLWFRRRPVCLTF